MAQEAQKFFRFDFWTAIKRLSRTTRRRSRLPKRSVHLESLESRFVPAGGIGQTIAPGIVAYPLTASASPINPNSIVQGADGGMWVGTALGNQIETVGRDGSIKYFTSPSLQQAEGLTLGSDGLVWFYDASKDVIGNISTAGVFTLFQGVGGGVNELEAISKGPDGKIWFASGNGIGSISTDGIITKSNLPPLNDLTSMTWAPDGSLWFTAFTSSTVGRISPDGQVATFTLPVVRGAAGVSLAVGPDNQIWFANTAGDQIGKISSSGSITAFALPPGSNPSGLLNSQDGYLWFRAVINGAGGGIGRISTQGVISEVPVANLGSSGGPAISSGGLIWVAGLQAIDSVDSQIMGSGYGYQYTAQAGFAFVPAFRGPIASVHLSASASTNTIDYGNGQVVTYPFLVIGDNSYELTGNQVYLQAGDHSITTTVVDVNGVRTIVHSTVHVTPELDVAFITKLYQTLLNRPADTSGVQYFLNQIQVGGTRALVVFEIEESPEYRQRIVDSLFASALHRLPEPTGAAFWSTFLAQGNSEEQMLVTLLSSPESLNFQILMPPNPSPGQPVLPTPDHRVSSIFYSLLGRAPSLDESDFWSSRLDSGAPTVAVVGQIAASLEAKANHVRMTYQSVLGRSPDGQGLAAWSNYLLAGHSVEELTVALAASPEYYSEAQK